VNRGAAERDTDGRKGAGKVGQTRAGSFYWFCLSLPFWLIGMSGATRPSSSARPRSITSTTNSVSRVTFEKLCPKSPRRWRLRPSDVRKAYGLPVSATPEFGLRPVFGAQPRNLYGVERKRRALPHIRRHSRIGHVRLFGQSPFEPFSEGPFLRKARRYARTLIVRYQMLELPWRARRP
jgi:hypothetical protein